MKRFCGDNEGVGPFVSSQERRAAVVPRVNHSLCSSIGLHRISLVRASGETFGTCVFDALQGTRDGCLLGEQFCRRPVLPGPAPPPRRAPPRPWPPVVCFLDSTGSMVNAICFCFSAIKAPILLSPKKNHWQQLYNTSSLAKYFPLVLRVRFEFRDMPCMKKVYKDKKTSLHRPATRNEDRPWSR